MIGRGGWAAGSGAAAGRADTAAAGQPLGAPASSMAVAGDCSRPVRVGEFGREEAARAEAARAEAARASESSGAEEARGAAKEAVVETAKAASARPPETLPLRGPHDAERNAEGSNSDAQRAPLARLDIHERAGVGALASQAEAAPSAAPVSVLPLLLRLLKRTLRVLRARFGGLADAKIPKSSW